MEPEKYTFAYSGDKFEGTKPFADMKTFLTQELSTLENAVREDERKKILSEINHEQSKFTDGFGHPKDCQDCKDALSSK